MEEAFHFIYLEFPLQRESRVESINLYVGILERNSTPKLPPLSRRDYTIFVTQFFVIYYFSSIDLQFYCPNIKP